MANETGAPETAEELADYWQSRWEQADKNEKFLAQQLTKTQAALDAALAGAQEDEQVQAEMRALLEEVISEFGEPPGFGVGGNAELAIVVKVRAFLAAHPATERGLEAEDA